MTRPPGIQVSMTSVVCRRRQSEPQGPPLSGQASTRLSPERYAESPRSSIEAVMESSYSCRWYCRSKEQVMRATRVTGSILFAILLLTSASLVRATTYVAVSDSDLVDQAAAVA